MTEFKHVHTFDGDELFISINDYNGRTLVCTSKRVYILNELEQLEPVEILKTAHENK